MCSPKPEQLERIELKTALATAKGIAEQTQGSVESINYSDIGNKENQVDEAIKSNDESQERLEPPPIASTIRRRGYRPAEGLFLGDPKGFGKEKKLDIINQGRL